MIEDLTKAEKGVLVMCELVVMSVLFNIFSRDLAGRGFKCDMLRLWSRTEIPMCSK